MAEGRRVGVPTATQLAFFLASDVCCGQRSNSGAVTAVTERFKPLIEQRVVTVTPCVSWTAVFVTAADFYVHQNLFFFLGGEGYTFHGVMFTHSALSCF